MAHDAFISHAHEDKTIADMVCARLEQDNIRCWIAPRDIQPGDDWADAILKGIQSSRVLVLVYSGAANRSPHVPREIDRAIGHQVPIVPFRIDQAPLQGRLEYSLSSLHWLDAITPPVEQHIKRLSQSIQSLLGAPQITKVLTETATPSVSNSTADAAPRETRSASSAEAIEPVAGNAGSVARRRPFGRVITAALVLTGIVVLLMEFKPWQGQATPPKTASGPTTSLTPPPSAIAAASPSRSAPTTPNVSSTAQAPSATTTSAGSTSSDTQDPTKGLCGVELPAGARRTLHRQDHDEYSVAMSGAEIESYFRRALGKDYRSHHVPTSAIGTLGGLLPVSDVWESVYSNGTDCILGISTTKAGQKFSLSATRWK